MFDKYFNRFHLKYSINWLFLSQSSLKAEIDPNYWNQKAKNALNRRLNEKPIVDRAKNVILFVGDGMGITTITPARILKGQLQNRSGEEAILKFEDFPYVSLIKVDWFALALNNSFCSF